MLEGLKNTVGFISSAVGGQQRIVEDIRSQTDAEIEKSKQLALVFGHLAIRDYQRNDPPHYELEMLESRHELEDAGLSWPDIGLKDGEYEKIEEIQKRMGLE